MKAGWWFGLVVMAWFAVGAGWCQGQGVSGAGRMRPDSVGRPGPWRLWLGHQVYAAPELQKKVYDLGLAALPGPTDKFKKDGYITGAFMAGVDCFPEGRVGMGMHVGFLQAGFNYSGGNNFESVRYRYLMAMVRGTLVYGDWGRVRLYGAMMAGRQWAWYKLRPSLNSTYGTTRGGTYPLEGRIRERYATTVQFSPLGLRMGGRQAGIWLEAGFGYYGLVQAGVDLRVGRP